MSEYQQNPAAEANIHFSTLLKWLEPEWWAHATGLRKQRRKWPWRAIARAQGMTPAAIRARNPYYHVMVMVPAVSWVDMMRDGHAIREVETPDPENAGTPIA